VSSEHGRYTFTEAGEMLEYLTSSRFRGYWIFAHNLEYDLGVLTSGRMSPFTCVFTKSRMLSAEIKNPAGHTWHFYDSANVFVGHTVEQLGELVHTPKLRLHPQVESHLRHGRPLADLTPDDQWRVLSYCLRDSEIVYQALSLLQHELLSLGGQLQSTIAGIAMDLYRRSYLREPWPAVYPQINSLARTAYYGARTEPYRLGRVEGVSGYDISSLYPSVQAAIQFPHPGALTLELSPASPAHTLSFEGVSRATVDVADQAVPPLPARVGYHLYFPTGRIEGSWTHLELRHALDHGATLKSLDWSLFSTRTFQPFDEFIEAMYERRLLHASSNDVRARLFKLILNSSYGRYGLDMSDPIQRLEPVDTGNWPNGYQGTEFKLIQGQPYVLRDVDNLPQPAYVNVPIAAYVAAGARVRMHHELSQHYDALAYTDTDSLWTTEPIEETPGLGGMRLEHARADLWIVAPKEYAVFSGESVIAAHAKGIPEQARLYYLRYGHASFDSPVRVREGMRDERQIAVWIRRLRQARRQHPKRALWELRRTGGDYWTTRPWNLEEIDRLVAQGFPEEQPPVVDPALAFEHLLGPTDPYKLDTTMIDLANSYDLL
jgi:hypothetical protein